MPALYRELWSARRSVNRSLALLLAVLVLVFILQPGVGARELDLEESSPLSYVAGSLSLSQVIAGEPAYFELAVLNSGGSDVTLDATTTLSFGSAETGQYVAPLLAPVTIPDGAQAVLRFQSTVLAAGFSPGPVAPVVAISGQDSGGGFTQTLAVGNSLNVLAPQTGLAEMAGTLQPTDPSRASMVVFWLRLENTTSCPIQLNSGSEIILRNEQEWLQRTPLYKSVSIQPGASARVEFGTLGEQGRASSYIKDSIPDGTYYPYLRLFGIRTCDDQPFSAIIESAQTLILNPLAGEIKGFGVNGGNWPTFTQEGGVRPVRVSSSTNDPNQILIQFTLHETTECDGSTCLTYPIERAHFDAEFAYLEGPGGVISNVMIDPEPGMASDLPWEIVARMYRLTRALGGGVGIVLGARLDVRFYVVQRNGLLNVSSIEPESTFVLRGESFQVRVAAQNPDVGDPDYPIHPLADSRLLMTQNAQDVTAGFDQTFQNPEIAIHQQNDRNLLFEIRPSNGGEGGKVEFGIFLSSHGKYPIIYPQGFIPTDTGERYNGPQFVTIPNAATIPAQATVGFAYLVDELPLAVDDSQPALLGRRARQLPITVNNAGRWNLTVEPASTVELAVLPKSPVVIDIGGDWPTSGLSSYAEWAQSFKSPSTFVLNNIDFRLFDDPNRSIIPEDLPYTIQVVPANADGTLPVGADGDVAPGDVIASAAALIPAGTPFDNRLLPVTTPAIDVRLEEGKIYYVIFRFGSAVTPYHLTGNYGDYPDGESYMRRISTNNAMAWRPVGSTDLDLRFNASHLIYRATTTLDSPLTLTTNGSAVVPFEFAQSFTDVADGIYAPIVTVVGTATGGGETFDYHQQVSAATSFVHIDEAPVVTGFTPPSGVPGTVITITGTQIGEAVSVSFNGAKTTPTIISDTTITAVVPVTTTTGRVSVTTLGGTTTSEADFTILPTITDFTPTSGTRRTEVKITGSGLAGATAVTFNGEPAEGFRTYVPTEVLALVPDTATTGKITVTTPAGVATSADDFTIDTAISFLSRDYGPVGTSVGLFGTALHQVIAVTFNGTPATFNAVSSVEIRAIVPLGATSGPVAVAGPDGSATSPKDFIVTPAITSIAPIFGQPGDTVAISGTTLDDATAVTFNGLAADFTVVSDVRVDAVVPLGAASGKLAVSTPQGTAVSVMDFTVVPAPATLTVVKETTGGGSADFSFTIVSEGPTREIRRQGAMEGSFAFPQYLAIDDDGNVYMTPVFGYGVWKFNARGVYLMHWGTEGSGSGQFIYPMGLAVDRDGNVYVADTYNNRIQKFDRNGVYLTQWGGPGTGNGQFTKPKDVAVDGEGNVYVADTDNYRVQKFDANGTYLDQWGGYGGADGMFARPEGIAVDVEGNVYVSDFYRRTIQKFDGAGSFLGKWGQPGSGPGQFDEPVGIAIDTAGNVYVADRNNHRVQKFDRNGVYLAQWGTLGAALGQFKDPYDVAVDGTGTFYVADKLNSRIQVFTDLGFALGGSSSQTWRLDPARYVITERAAPGWGASSIECDGGSPVTSDRGVSLTLPPGTNVRCTFTSAPLKPPSISGFSPTLGPTGTTVTITGTNLAGVTSVAFNGVPAAQVTFVSDGEITAVVPAGATTGKLSVSNADGAATSEADFVVTHPPAPPSEPEPTTGTAGVKVDALLAWSASDPDGDALTYEVRFGTADPPPTVVAGQSAKTYDPPGDLAYHTTYYWQIVARDEFNERPGQVWSFTTLNRPPAAPANPSPADAAPAQAVTTALAWSGSESDGDALTYEVRFGATNPPPTVVASQSEAAYDPPGDLSPHTIYFWQIVADDGHGGVTSGPVWSFTTLNRPPVAPSGTNPDDAASGVALDTTLAWTGGDPDEDPVTYEVRFGTTNPPSQVVANQSATTYDPPGDLTHHTTYYWQIVARDEHGGETAGPVWRFTTLNRAPAAPGGPSPADGATAQAATTALSWSGSDPDGDPLTYEVRFGTANPPPTVVAGQSATTYDPPGNLAAHTTLYWQIVAKDAAHPNGTPGPVWQFTTANTAPAAPSNPTPANGATNVALGTQVCWTAATDPDGDAVTYDVAFGTSNPPPAAATGQSTTCYDPPGDLTAGTPYYWKVTAKDAFGGSAPGSVWSFTTAGGGGTFPDVFYLSPSANVTIGGIAAQGADVLRYTKSINSWAMLFDGSDHGLTKNVSAFTFLDDGSLLFVLAANQTVAGLGTAMPYDVVKFTPNTPGVFPLGAGAYDWYFRGRDHFLTTSGEKIDAIDVDGNRLLLSTGGAASVGLASGGTLKAADEDVFVFNVGTNAYESALLIDGSKMPGMAVEDITGIWDDPQSGDYYVTILGTFNLGGVKGNDKSIVKLTPNGGASVYTPSLVNWLAAGATLPTAFKIDGLEMAR